MGLFSKPDVLVKILAIGLGGWLLPQSMVAAQSGELLSFENPAVDAVKSNDDSTSSNAVLGNLAGDEPLSAALMKSVATDLSVDRCHRGHCVGDLVSLDVDSDPGESDAGNESDLEDEVEPATSQPDYRDASDAYVDDELGILRVRSQPVGIDGELGTLRVRTTEDVPLEVEPKPTRQDTVFLTARSNLYGGNNLFRTPDPISDRIYQAGVGLFAFPQLSDKTNLILSAEMNWARYEELSVVDYDELQFQAGIRQRLGTHSYGQLNWRYQDLSTPRRNSFFSAHYIELLLSHRDILSNRTWADLYYQARLSLSDPKEFSRVSQIATGSLNYGFDPETRASLIYQLFLDDYIETARYDAYHQILAQLSHDISSTTRLSLFTGFRFGHSTQSSVDFDDTIYGASVNVNLPLF